MTTTDKREILDIVALVENNPLTRLTGNYGSKIIQKIKNAFTTDEEQLFIGGFYCYFNYNPTLDFVIFLHLIWRWLGYSRIEECKRCLVKNFKENVDYKIENFAPQDGGAKTNPVEREQETRGGHNKESIVLTINCFKKLCLKSKTAKADQIHDYYIKLEDLIMELVTEQTTELQLRLQDKDQQLKLKGQDIENTLLLNFGNKQVVYFIFVETIGEEMTSSIIKFGCTKDIIVRMKEHRSTYGQDIKLLMVFETVYNREFETMVKQDSVIKPHIIQKIYSDKLKIEMIKLDDKFTLVDLNKRVEYLKERVKGDLVSNLLNEISDLKAQIAGLNGKNDKELSNMKEQVLDLKIKVANKHINDLTTPVLPPKIVKTNQPKIQLYDKDTFRLIKTYKDIEHACQETVLYSAAVPQSVNKSIRNSTLYKNYRFWSTTEDKEHQITETVELTKQQTHQRVVQVKNGNIVGIYSCTKTAAEFMFKGIKDGSIVLKNEKSKLSTLNQINKNITNSLSIHTNHTCFEQLWYRENDVPEKMKAQFELYKANNIVPDLKIHKNNKPVYKYDTNYNLVHTYLSKVEAMKGERVSEKNLGKFILDRALVNNHYLSLTKIAVQGEDTKEEESEEESEED